MGKIETDVQKRKLTNCDKTQFSRRPNGDVAHLMNSGSKCNLRPLRDPRSKQRALLSFTN